MDYSMEEPFDAIAEQENHSYILRSMMARLFGSSNVPAI
jgi:hypothetical protein